MACDSMWCSSINTVHIYPEFALKMNCDIVPFRYINNITRLLCFMWSFRSYFPFPKLVNDTNFRLLWSRQIRTSSYAFNLKSNDFHHLCSIHRIFLNPTKRNQYSPKFFDLVWSFVFVLSHWMTIKSRLF